VAFTEHHESHAASAFFPSPFADAAILTVDGVGEWATACIGHGSGNRFELLEEMRFPHSLGLLYSAFTHHCGFRVNSGEYKLMGLAPFGEPRFADLIEAELMDLKEDGSFRLNMAYFGYCGGLAMTAPRFERLFGGPRRRPESPITRREADIAASIQKVTEKVVLRMAAHARRLTGSRNLCMAGGVALNCVANGLVLREALFDGIWIQPASGDAGGALGSALFTWHQLLGNPRQAEGSENQGGSLLGPEYAPAEIEAALLSSGCKYRRIEGPGALCREAARHVAEGKVLGWMQGRMEFGPRALGNRSILGDARNPKMQSLMNLKVKLRESFRPFAPVVLAERAAEYFEIRPGEESPYMLITAAVRDEKLVGPRSAASGGELLARIQGERSVIPAVTHIDGSARIQTVDRQRNPRLRELLERFDEATGCPVLINTSFNIRGEPVVCTPLEALRCFLATDIDVLVIGDFMLLKDEQPSANRPRLEDYVGRYGDD
jgi:carbamoyltransferase